MYVLFPAEKHCRHLLEGRRRTGGAKVAFKERWEVGAPPWIVLWQKLEGSVVDACAGAGRVKNDGVLLEACVGR